MLKTYEKCPKKYFFKYVKGLQMPVNDDIFIEGKNIHALASYYIKGENINEMEKSLSEREREQWNYLKTLEYFNYDKINAEYSLSTKIGDYFFGGRLDALVKKDDRYYILDYKTGATPIMAAYDFQTMIYMMCVITFFKTNNVTFVYINLKNKSEVKIELHEGFISEYKSKLINIADKIAQDNYKAITNNCKSCEYGKICYEKVLN